jgi:2-polyprenyl-6-hydroxyphenyl methylase/3-demethylubiquinone-9 3-methyltransferase
MAEAARFAFGENWSRFLAAIDERRVEAAKASLRERLGVADLTGATFLDVGCGSGLFSLAAARLGAARVHSFDYDPESVRCAEVLRSRYGPTAPWTIERGSALDEAYLARLGRWDVVYSWGVLHHTGDMWRALALVARCVAPGGRLFVAIYNDQGWRSKLWTLEKRLYVAHPVLRPVLAGAAVTVAVPAWAVADLAAGRLPWVRYRTPRPRGMAWWRDLIDWIGGYPFEVATTAALEQFYRTRGFTLTRLVSCGRRSGCNELVFRAGADADHT